MQAPATEEATGTAAEVEEGAPSHALDDVAMPAQEMQATATEEATGAAAEVEEGATDDAAMPAQEMQIALAAALAAETFDEEV